MTANVCLGDDCHQKTIKFYWADACGNCTKSKPIFDELVIEHPEIVFEKIDYSAQYKSGQFPFGGYPAFVGFNGNEQVRITNGFAGEKTKQHILDCLTPDPVIEAQKVIDANNKAITDKCWVEVQAVLKKYGCTISSSPFINKI